MRDFCKVMLKIFYKPKRELTKESIEKIIDVVKESVDIIEVMKPVYNFKAAE